MLPNNNFKRIVQNTYFRMPLNVRQMIYRRFRYQEYKQLQRLRDTDQKDQRSLAAFDTHHCIFVHIPKTGGLSVAKSLLGNLGGGHIKIHLYQMVFSVQELDSYFKFAFVRNPWDRLVSAFHFLKKGGLNQADERWADKHLADYDTFEQFVYGWLNQGNIYSQIHFVPQYNFVCVNDYTPRVDFIGRFENIQQDFEFIRTKLGIQAELKHLNASKRHDYRMYYNRETSQIVADVYREDIEIFGYKSFCC